MPEIDVVVFDLDGTLIDSAPDLHVAANRLLVEEGQPPLDLAAIESMVGEGVARLVERIFAAVDITLAPTAVDRYSERFRALYLEGPCRYTQPMPGAVACVEQLAGTYPLAICTNKPVAHTSIILEALGWSSRFAVVVGGDSLAVRKPDPAPLCASIERAGGRVERSVFVGDSGTDVATARAAKVTVLVVEGGYSRIPARELGADGVIANLAALPLFLDKMRAT